MIKKKITTTYTITKEDMEAAILDAFRNKFRELRDEFEGKFEIVIGGNVVAKTTGLFSRIILAKR